MHNRGEARRLLLVVALLALAIFSLIPPQAEGAGVGVLNTPPTFVSLDVRDLDIEMELVINASDYNGWEDIFRVTVIVSDPSGGIVSEAIYQQYPTNTSTVRIDRFEDVTGGFLKPENQADFYEGSRVTRFSSSSGWFLENTTQQITFLYTPFGGTTVYIVMEDMAGTRSTHEGPFSSRFQEPPLLTDEVTPVGISMAAAAVGGAAAIIDRRGSNRMARTVERMRKGGGL